MERDGRYYLWRAFNSEGNLVYLERYKEHSDSPPLREVYNYENGLLKAKNVFITDYRLRTKVDHYEYSYRFDEMGNWIKRVESLYVNKFDEWYYEPWKFSIGP